LYEAGIIRGLALGGAAVDMEIGAGDTGFGISTLVVGAPVRST
jgi:hypothetical protein